MSKLDIYEIRPFPPMRKLAVDADYLARGRSYMRGLMEVDVTAARQIIREHKARTGEAISFTAFLLVCIGQAVETHKEVQAYQDWRGRLFLFDDVDVATLVETEMQGQKLALVHIVRAANRKTVRDISDEIRAAQARPASPERLKTLQLFVRLPAFLRRLFFRYVMGRPHRSKEYRGTVALTSVGMFVGGGGWGLATPSHTLNLVVGGIAEKPVVVDGQIAIREVLNLTVEIDHDMVDGAPAARFGRALRELIEHGYGLPDGSAPVDGTPGAQALY